MSVLHVGDLTGPPTARDRGRFLVHLPTNPRGLVAEVTGRDGFGERRSFAGENGETGGTSPLPHSGCSRRRNTFAVDAGATRGPDGQRVVPASVYGPANCAGMTRLRMSTVVDVAVSNSLKSVCQIRMRSVGGTWNTLRRNPPRACDHAGHPLGVVRVRRSAAIGGSGSRPGWSGSPVAGERSSGRCVPSGPSPRRYGAVRLWVALAIWVPASRGCSLRRDPGR